MQSNQTPIRLGSRPHFLLGWRVQFRYSFLHGIGLGDPRNALKISVTLLLLFLLCYSHQCQCNDTETSCGYGGQCRKIYANTKVAAMTIITWPRALEGWILKVPFKCLNNPSDKNKFYPLAYWSLVLILIHIT